MPLPEPMSFPLSTYEPLALVKVHTHDATPISAHRLLHALFGIPPAEYRLLLLLMQGHHVKECAQQLGVSQETTRTQLKSLFRRTQTSRQSQLIDLVRKLTYGHMD
ncbi:LuxR C-terminal-related transcriptional regulator [Pigmentiphaga sp. CHJ604]